MKTMIIACETLKRELMLAQERTGNADEVLWFESGLHNLPKKLNGVLQKTIDEAETQGAERLLLSMGTCGNSVEGIHTHGAELILPRVDDCISLLLGSCKIRQAIQREGGTYFMTKGWLEGERNIWVEYEYTMKKYGEEAGREIFDMMFGSYRRIGILDTHAYEMKEVEQEVAEIAKTLALDWEKFDASIRYLEDLLTGPWDDGRFIVMKPGETLEAKQLFLEGV